MYETETQGVCNHKLTQPNIDSITHKVGNTNEPFASYSVYGLAIDKIH